MAGCLDHPQYKAKSRPKSSCARCREMYFARLEAEVAQARRGGKTYTRPAFHLDPDEGRCEDCARLEAEVAEFKDVLRKIVDFQDRDDVTFAEAWELDRRVCGLLEDGDDLTDEITPEAMRTVIEGMARGVRRISDEDMKEGHTPKGATGEGDLARDRANARAVAVPSHRSCGHTESPGVLMPKTKPAPER